MKLFIKVIIARTPVIIIAITLKTEAVLPSAIAAFKGIVSPNKAINVTRTAI